MPAGRPVTRRVQPRTRNGINEEIEILRDAVEREPAALLLALELGSRYTECGEYLSALAVFQDCIIRYPQFPEAWVRFSSAATAGARQVLDRLLAGPDGDAPRVRTDHLTRLAVLAPGFSEWVGGLPAIPESDKSDDIYGDVARFVNRRLDMAELDDEQARHVARFLDLAALAAAPATREGGFFAPSSLAVRSSLSPSGCSSGPCCSRGTEVRKLAVALRVIEFRAMRALVEPAQDPAPDVSRFSRWWAAVGAALFGSPLYPYPLKHREIVLAAAVERDGTGWRAPLMLAACYLEDVRALEAVRDTGTENNTELLQTIQSKRDWFEKFRRLGLSRAVRLSSTATRGTSIRSSRPAPCTDVACERGRERGTGRVDEPPCDWKAVIPAGG